MLFTDIGIGGSDGDDEQLASGSKRRRNAIPWSESVIGRHDTLEKSETFRKQEATQQGVGPFINQVTYSGKFSQYRTFKCSASKIGCKVMLRVDVVDGTGDQPTKTWVTQQHGEHMHDGATTQGIHPALRSKLDEQIALGCTGAKDLGNILRNSGLAKGAIELPQAKQIDNYVNFHKGRRGI